MHRTKKLFCTHKHTSAIPCNDFIDCHLCSTIFFSAFIIRAQTVDLEITRKISGCCNRTQFCLQWIKTQSSLGMLKLVLLKINGFVANSGPVFSIITITTISYARFVFMALFSCERSKFTTKNS